MTFSYWATQLLALPWWDDPGVGMNKVWICEGLLYRLVLAVHVSRELEQLMNGGRARANIAVLKTCNVSHIEELLSRIPRC